MDTPAPQLREFLDNLVTVKQALYKQFLAETEQAHEQNVGVITKDYPRYLARWAAELCKGPANIPPPAAKADPVLLSALGGLKAAMENLLAAEDYGGDMCKHYITALLVTYPYAMNMKSMS